MFIRTFVFVALSFASVILWSASDAQAQIAVKAETVWTMNGAPISNGVVLIKDGKIEAVGTASQIRIPNGYKVVSAKVATPGLIDARTVVGLNGYLNQPHDQMALDGSAPIQPELRAIDSYDGREKLVEYLREFGITTIHTGHQPSALVSGQMMVVKTLSGNLDDVVVNPFSALSVTLGQSSVATGGRAPGTRAKQISMIRGELSKAKASKADGPRDLRSEVWKRVLAGEIPLLVNAETAIDMMNALRLADEFDIRIILEGGAESYQLLERIKSSGFPVIVHPPMARATGDRENLSLETPAKLKAAGIPVAFQSGYEGYVPKTRVVLFEAAIAIANGMSREEAMASLTIDAAKILGLDSRIGSLAVGKDADIALYNGDPFEFTTHCIGTIINGKMASDTKR
jgi:imidazolonepropionase-like amidohydrolase